MLNEKILNGDKITVKVGKLNIGESNKPVIMAGPCSIESRNQIIETALELKEIGVDVLRGGAFKPRTSPYAFQGLGFKGLEYLKEAGEKAGIPVVTELMGESDINEFLNYTDIVQIGSRNMYNYSLLKVIGEIDKPILLKRGMSATLNEWIMAAEYIAAYGNKNIILCERGIRTFENITRNTLDLSAVPLIKEKTGLPVIVDPSHGTGIRRLIEPMSKAGIACGADGLMIEVHLNPEEALCDGKQSITIEQYKRIYDWCKKYVNVENL
ncbi:MAG: 3-deoxy-7-phosphoheptulonate synthase [Firmicutes bacterium]|nr:3-deoxy-7-phosphoheptulonate synthase [Bacillota bacterium]